MKLLNRSPQRSAIDICELGPIEALETSAIAATTGSGLAPASRALKRSADLV